MKTEKADRSYAFTVFTPTFNRSHILHRVYNSLKKQTFRDFEWIIVDDGSADGTQEMVRKWENEAEFPIRYFYQTNQGKHFAFNRAAKEAKGELFLPLDSDDECVPSALEKLKLHWDMIPTGERKGFSGVTALCMDEKGVLIGDRFPRDILDSDALELRFRYKVKGEKWGFTRTDILRQYPFPEVKGTHYVSEGIVWNAIAHQFKTRFINEVLRIYHLSDDDTGQLTRLNPGKDAGCNIPYLQSLLNNDIQWFYRDPKQFLFFSVLYSRYSFHMKKGIIEQMSTLHNFVAVFLWLCLLPLGYYLYNKDIRRTARLGEASYARIRKNEKGFKKFIGRM